MPGHEEFSPASPGHTEPFHALPIQQRIDWLLARAEQHSKLYSAPEAVLERERYRASHPTALAALKWMDGRLNLAYATGTPIGLIQPFRNLGGRFDLGWPHLGEVLSSWVMRQVRDGRRVLLLLNYHYSRGSRERGCAGFGYDTEAAHAHVRTLRGQVEQVFGGGHGTVYPLVCGFETDEDALCLHAPTGEVLDLARLDEHDQDALPHNLAALFADMPEQVRHDLLPLLRGNLAHVRAIRASQRPPEVEHREWVLCVGRGFDVLHMPNHALIVGPYSPRLDQSIDTAASIIESNMRAGRIPDDGFLLLASVPFEEQGPDRARGVEGAVSVGVLTRSDQRAATVVGRAHACAHSRARLVAAAAAIAAGLNCWRRRDRMPPAHPAACVPAGRSHAR